MSRTTTAGLAVLFAILPLYGTFAQLAPETPGIPPLVPRAAAVAVAVVGLVALLAVVPAGLRAARRDALTFAFLGPGVATVLAGLTGFDPPLGIGLGLFVTGFGFAALALDRAADARAVRLCIRVFLWSALAAGALALAMLLARRPVALYAFYHARAVGTFLNPNELAAFAIVVLGVAVPLAVLSRGRDRLATVCGLVMLVTLGATFSRWGALSAVCGVAVYALFARARALVAAALVVAAAGIALNAVAGAGHHNPRDDEARAVAWQAGLTTFARFPLLGVGPLAFPRTYDEMRPPSAPGTRAAVAFDPHSLPIAFAADGGIVAVVTLAIAFTIVLRTVLRRARSASARSGVLALAVAAALVALLIHTSINTVSLFFPLGLQVVPLALAVVRTDALR
ncbi:MAG TPA: O-antigen ligase family protein [Candidatus Elarobacter sp.]